MPERRVEDAWRNLLVQNLTLTWRYSIGNPYEEFSFPEGVDVAQVMSAQGFFGSRPRDPLDVAHEAAHAVPELEDGPEARRVGALLPALPSTASYIDRVTPVLRGYVDDARRQIAASPRGILGRERYSSDIADSVYGLHSQAVVWQGLRAMAPGLG